MNRLDLLQTFVDVVRAGNFSEAARRLRVPRSTVSLRIRMLEDASGATLFKRSTRAVILTDAGAQLYADVQTPIRLLNAAWVSARQSRPELHGVVRMAAPADFPTALLADAIAGFRSNHPTVSFQLAITDMAHDLRSEDLDLALRIGASNSKDTVIRGVLPVQWRFYAGAGWIERYGAPDRIADIKSFLSSSAPLRAYLETEVLTGKRLPLPVIEVDNDLVARDLVARDVGVGLLPAALCRELELAGRLVPILGDAITADVPISLSFASGAEAAPQVRAFAIYLADLLGRRIPASTVRQGD
jgi:DNA-binding transcriptional LysR family regulator